MRFEKLRILLITLMFVSIISFPFLNNRFGFIHDIKNSENRRLAPEPSLDLKHPDLFPAQYEKFYNDTFSLRSRIIKIFNLYNIIVFKKSGNPLICIGNDGWLFFKGDELDTYTGKNPFTQQELIDFKTELEYRKEYLKKRNCKFYFLIAPAKANIYSEKVPLEILKKNNHHFGEELLDFLKKNSTVNTVNLYPVLRENKKNYRTYYSLDNHWSRMGAFYGTNQFLLQLKKDFPAINALSLNDYVVSEEDITTGNTVKGLGDINIFHDVNYILTGKQKSNVVAGKLANYAAPKGFPYPWLYQEVKEIENSHQPKILIISDSFGEYAFSLLTPNFKKTLKIWDNWEYKLNEDIIENEKPDIMLLITHEKNLRSILKHASGLSNKN